MIGGSLLRVRIYRGYKYTKFQNFGYFFGIFVFLKAKYGALQGFAYIQNLAKTIQSIRHPSPNARIHTKCSFLNPRK